MKKSKLAIVCSLIIPTICILLYILINLHWNFMVEEMEKGKIVLQTVLICTVLMSCSTGIVIAVQQFKTQSEVEDSK